MYSDAITQSVFRANSSSHWAALGAIALALLVMVLMARMRLKTGARMLELGLALLLLVQWPLTLWYYKVTGTATVNNSFPCHLCDFACCIAAIALITHRRPWFELLYFLGLAGTMQGLITPTLTQDWPSPRFLLFFLSHGGVVVAALYGVLGLGTVIRSQAKWIAWITLNAYALGVGGFNYLMQANYGFLCRKPDTASLYDALGPWPWYLVVASGVAMIIFLILDLPFVFIRKKLRHGS